MKPDSRFYFTGSAVLTLCFLLTGQWLLLVLPFFVMLYGVFIADREQYEAMDEMAMQMLVPQASRPAMLSHERFECHELLFVHAGCPVYRYLHARQVRWALAGAAGEVDSEGDAITVFPGFVYRRCPA